MNKPDADKRFGAALMKDAELVGECLRRMKEAVDVPVTLKHRLGVRSGSGGLHDARGYDKESDTDGYHFVSNFVDTVHELSGVEHFIAHARCAVLSSVAWCTGTPARATNTATTTQDSDTQPPQHNTRRPQPQPQHRHTKHKT